MVLRFVAFGCSCKYAQVLLFLTWLCLFYTHFIFILSHPNPPPPEVTSGHMVGAVNVPFMQFIKPDTHTMKDPADLKEGERIHRCKCIRNCPCVCLLQSFCLNMTSFLIWCRSILLLTYSARVQGQRRRPVQTSCGDVWLWRECMLVHLRCPPRQPEGYTSLWCGSHDGHMHVTCNEALDTWVVTCLSSWQGAWTEWEKKAAESMKTAGVKGEDLPQ